MLLSRQELEGDDWLASAENVRVWSAAHMSDTFVCQPTLLNLLAVRFSPQRNHKGFIFRVLILQYVFNHHSKFELKQIPNS